MQGRCGRGAALITPLLNRNAVVRIVPFAVFMLLLQLRGLVPADGSWGFDGRWVYGATVLLVGGLLLAWRREYGELARQVILNKSETRLQYITGTRQGALSVISRFVPEGVRHPLRLRCV